MKSFGVASESATREAAGAQLSGRWQISTEPSLRFRGKGLMCTGARGDESQRWKSRARNLVQRGGSQVKRRLRVCPEMLDSAPPHCACPSV